jgi:hypothetical protein
VLLLLPALLNGQDRQENRPRILALSHVTVIDGTGGRAQPDMTVVIADGRIAAVGPSARAEVPEGAQRVDGTGQFLIPGLWDMHVHWSDAAFLPLFTANGVTGVRVMWGLPVHLQWRKALAAGKFDGPRLFLAGPIVDGPSPIWKASVAVATEEEARRAVRKTKEDGYDFVKVYNLLPREAYLAIADESRKQEVPFAGHSPYAVSAGEVSDAGQQTIEHLEGILLACSGKEAELRKQLIAATRDFPNRDLALLRRINEEMLDAYDPDKAAALFARLKKNHTWQVPTLTVLRAIARLDDEAFTKDPRLKYMPSAIRKMWDPKNDERFKTYTRDDFAQRRRLFEKSLEVVGAIRRAGVGLLAGTDVLNPYCFPGFSLHDELELLVKAGLSPMEALQAATRDPARLQNKEKEFGTVEPGRAADLVLLEANPLDDIGNTRKIAAVVLRGELLPKERLRKMLGDVEAAAAK